MNVFRDIRVIPVVLVAIFGLAVLKVAGLVLDGGYVFDYQPQTTQRSWAEDNFNFPTGKKPADTADITGSVEKPKEESAKPQASAPEAAKPSETNIAAPNARCSSGCRHGGRNLNRGPARSIFARVC
jgi:hypothetical protein